MMEADGCVSRCNGCGLDLLVGAGLLVIVIAAFFGYARYRVRRGLAGLPGRLGATITRESNGYTYSQSDGKNTVFTIHASKAVEHADGKYTLHGVSMILYGHKGERADRISGSEFEYDTRAEVIRAVGPVHIDLEAPVAEGSGSPPARTSEASRHLDPASVSTTEAGAGSRVIHVTTSGLIYAKKLATASTDQGLEFAFNGFSGHAVGAEYNSDSGLLVLQSAVTVSGIDRGKPIALQASHGELHRGAAGAGVDGTNQASGLETTRADFDDARYTSSSELAQAQVAHLRLRPDGGVDRVEGVGQVVLERSGQGRATSDRADLTLDAKNKPKTAVLTGNVKFSDDEAFRQARGESQTATLNFDEQGRLEHTLLHGRVFAEERVKVSEQATAPWSDRTLSADTVDLALAAEPDGKRAQLRDALASGSARLNTVTTVLPDATATGAATRPPTRSETKAEARPGTTTNTLAADNLQARFIDQRGVAELSTVHGSGHTVLEQSAPGGAGRANLVQKSQGDTLDVQFREVAGRKGSVEVAQAVQQGGVVLDRTVPAKDDQRVPAKDDRTVPAKDDRTVPAKSAAAGAAPETQHAVAMRAAFDAESGKMTLTGGVKMSDPTSTISAEKVVMDRESGDATAEGGVKVTYLQPGAAEAVHVLAARAELMHDQGQATFYGRGADAAGLARMWQAGATGQGGSQIEAPVLVFEQEAKRLTARAERAGTMGTVRTVLTSAPPQRGASRGTQARAGETPTGILARTPGQQVPIRIISSEMVYTDSGPDSSHPGSPPRREEERQAIFRGGVRLIDAQGEMRAQEATVFLLPPHTGPPKADTGAAQPPAGMLGGQVDRMVATRQIELTQPGRIATGERLVYTASDQMFVLTGTAAAPPKVVDGAQGRTTGAMLRFHSGDDSVSVVGSDGSVPPRKVHTETSTQTKVKQ